MLNLKVFCKMLEGLLVWKRVWFAGLHCAVLLKCLGTGQILQVWVDTCSTIVRFIPTDACSKVSLILTDKPEFFILFCKFNFFFVSAWWLITIKNINLNLVPASVLLIWSTASRVRKIPFSELIFFFEWDLHASLLKLKSLASTKIGKLFKNHVVQFF